MNTLTTTDIYLAAALASLGAKLDKVDKTDPKHMKFTFSPRPSDFKTGELETISQNLSGLEALWANKQLMVNAVEYAEAIKRLKSIVHTS